MRAVVFHAIGDIRLDNVTDPVIQEPTDALVRLTASAICGTDLHMVRGTMPGMKSGTILGHEGVGIGAGCGPQHGQGGAADVCCCGLDPLAVSTVLLTKRARQHPCAKNCVDALGGGSKPAREHGQLTDRNLGSLGHPDSVLCRLHCSPHTVASVLDCPPAG